jgi:biotin operon repressor
VNALTVLSPPEPVEEQPLTTPETGPDQHDPHVKPTRPERHLQRVDPDAPPRVWTPELWTAARLMDTDFPTPKWAVPGILCEGLSLLAGPPKVGKSWLSLSLALACASGGNAFGKIPVRQGPVLYLALEDTPRRLKNRLGMLLKDTPAPPGLDIAVDWPLMPAGGDQALARWLDHHRDARLIVIDVFAKVRGMVPQGMSAYDADYAAIGRIKRVADAYGVAVVLVHHVRKAGNEDFLQEVSGTNGIAGAADATLVLRRPRGQADGVLLVTGRDVEEAEYALTKDPDTSNWLMLDGPAGDHQLGETRAVLLRHVRANGPIGPKEIAETLGMNRETVKKTLQRMHADGQVSADAAGRYSAPDPEQTAITAPDPAGDTTADPY